jgi:hypothetical protein
MLIGTVLPRRGEVTTTDEWARTLRPAAAAAPGVS